jgi:hypothetical protein
MRDPGGRRVKPRIKKGKGQGQTAVPDIPHWKDLTTPPSVLPQPQHGPNAGGPTGGLSAPVGKGAPSKPGVGLSPVDQAHAIAMSQLQPELDQFDSQQRQEQSAHDARTGQITGWNKWYQDQLNSAFNDTTNALNTLISSSASSGQGAQDALTAALRSGAMGQSDLERMVGGQGPQGGEQAALQAAVDRRTSGDRATADLATAELGAQGQRRSLAGTSMMNMQETEGRRSRASLKEINQGKTDVLNRLPGLEQVALKDQRDFQLAKSQLGEQRANRLFQQWLSKKELGLKTRDQSFQEYLANEQLGLSKQELGLKKSQFLHDAQIDWANVGINRQQLENQLAQISQDAKTAKGKDARERAKLRGQAIAAGVEALSGYMAPQTGEAQPGVEGGAGLNDPSNMTTDPTTGAKIPGKLRVYRRTYDGAMRTLIQTGVPRSDALRILKNSEFASWRNRASQEFDRLKRRGAAGYRKGSGRPD